jgi:hypothetical protein
MRAVSCSVLATGVDLVGRELQPSPRGAKHLRDRHDGSFAAFASATSAASMDRWI